MNTLLEGRAEYILACTPSPIKMRPVAIAWDKLTCKWPRLTVRQKLLYTGRMAWHHWQRRQPGRRRNQRAHLYLLSVDPSTTMIFYKNECQAPQVSSSVRTKYSKSGFVVVYWSTRNQHAMKGLVVDWDCKNHLQNLVCSTYIHINRLHRTLFLRGVRSDFAGTKSGNAVDSHKTNTTTVVFHR